MELRNSLIRFDFDIEDKILILGVIILDEPHPSEELTNLLYKEKSDFSDLITKLEDKYGVLDVSYGEEELIGYTSYEITENNVIRILKEISVDCLLNSEQKKYLLFMKKITLKL